MKTLSRYHKTTNRLINSFDSRHKKSSSIASIQMNRSVSEEEVREEITAQVSILQSLVQSCARNRAVIAGKSCHTRVIYWGLGADVLTSNMLINLYAKCGLVSYARKVFDEMPERSLVSWNTVIGVYGQNRKEKEAFELFLFMQRGRIRFTEFTISSILCACSVKIAVFECKQLHCLAVKAAIDSNGYVGTALVDVYGKCGLVKDAREVFESMPEKSSVAWSCMVTGFVQNELYEEAFLLFRRIQLTGLELDQHLFSAIFCACAGLAALIEGKQVHAVLCKTGFHENIFVASSLIDMYAKCGSVREAYNLFANTEEKNVVSWNVMLSALAKHARPMEAMVLFEKMQQIGLHPNELTYVSILSACSHVGFVEEAQKYFDLMSMKHKITPNAIHYSCMVDILGRAGKICEAYDLIKTMPLDATASMWGSLLASCRVHGNLELAEIAAKHLFEIEPDNAGNHILLANIYAANKKWEEVARGRKFLKESDVKKEIGKSWIEIKDKVHIFTVGERNHPRISEIYLRLDSLVEEMNLLGYKVETEHDLHDVEESRKQVLLRHHSEKLALAFGILCLPPHVPIRIMKNLRICGDCHSFMKLASSITRREIVVRDVNRFHHFKEGSCSCGEFW